MTPLKLRGCSSFPFSRTFRPVVTPRSSRPLPPLAALGSEVGLSWPLVLVGSEALGADRNSILNFSKRCQWRGSSASRQVEVALMAAWNGGVCWQTSFRESGCPLVL